MMVRDVKPGLLAGAGESVNRPVRGDAANAVVPGSQYIEVPVRAECELARSVEQGIEIGRPSIILVEADRAGGQTTAIRVGGTAVAVSSGTMSVPD